MIPLAKPCFGPEEERAVAEVLRTGWVAQGPTTDAFEGEFADTIGVEHAVAASSCTTALHLAMVALGVRSGDEVILPSYTFPATANAVLYEGATPVLVDIDPATLNIDPRAAEAAVTARTKAIIGVHLFGCPCDVNALRSICDAKKIAFVEDAACAIGTRVGTQMAGAFGDIACFSFHARKVVTTGEGGMLTTADERLAELMRSLRSHGVDRSASVRHAQGLAPANAQYVRVGYNYRLSDLQSAVGRVQLRKLDRFVEERNEMARRYDDAFADMAGFRLPPRRLEGTHSYQSYVIVLENDAPIEPDAFMARLAEREISTRVGTYAVHRQPYFAGASNAPLPHSTLAADRSVALPLFNGLPSPDQKRVIDTVRQIWEESGATR